MAKGMMHNPNHYSDLLMVHLLIYSQSGWNALEYYLLKWHLLHNPIFPHSIHLTPLRVPSKKYGPKIQLAVTLALSSCVVGGLTSQACNKYSVLPPKKHFKIRSCSKLHFHLKRELSHATRLPEIIPTTKQMLCDTVSCQYHWVQLQTMAKMTSSPSPSCGQTWSNGVLQVPLIVSAWTYVVIVQWKWHPQHRSPFGIMVDCSEENPSYSST